MIEIRHRYTSDVLFRFETASTIREALEQAVAVGARLDGASLDGARLDGASLDGARLDGASLDGASLDGASLRNACLDDASLVNASLNGARLDGASLDGASLRNVSLVHARLDGARLDSFRDDMYEVLKAAPAEVPGLLLAIREGRVDGSTYEGPCACLVGTIANVRGCSFRELPGVTPDARRPAEVWFMAIRRGDRPDNSQVSAITERWIVDWRRSPARAG